METDDLFLAALGLLRGGELLGVSVRGTNGRRMAVFSVAGDEVDAAVREYHKGEALVDLRLLKTEVRRLKDLAFDALRAEERRSYAGDQGRDRAYQGGESHRGRRR